MTIAVDMGRKATKTNKNTPCQIVKSRNSPCVLRGVGGEGGTQIFSFIRRLDHFLGFKILNFNIFGGFQKNEYFLGYEDFVGIFFG